MVLMGMREKRKPFLVLIYYIFNLPYVGIQEP